MGQRSIGQFLGERAKTRALEEKRRAEKVAIGEAEKRALATVTAQRARAAEARAKEERGVTEQRRREEAITERKKIPTAQTPQQIALEKARLDKLTADLEAEGGPAALTPAQKLSFDKQVLKSEGILQGVDDAGDLNIDNPAAKPHMDWVNQNANKPYYYRQREVRDPNILLPRGLEGTKIEGQQIPLPRGLTMDKIKVAAEANGVDVETILRALPELKEYFQE